MTIKDIVARQKGEKERLLAMPYIKREKEEFGKKWLKTSLIKVILGPRRAGKSVLAIQLLREYNFAYFNFDNDGLLGENDGLDLNELMDELTVQYNNPEFILFDEIQNLKGWELFVNRLQREGFNLVVTGSNASLLSKELATHLTGRHMEIEILPFSFKEILLFHNSPEYETQKKVLLGNYLVNGGYPDMVVNKIDPNGYLDILFDAILFKDVINRYKVRSGNQINTLSVYLINNIASKFNAFNIKNILKLKSNTTVDKYISYLVESYLLFSLSNFSFSPGNRLTSIKKVYTVDNGFVLSKGVQHSNDYGKLFENMVFVELIKSGLKPNRNLFYFKTRNNKEIDFLIREGHIARELIQVCYDMSNKDTEKREVTALLEASEELKVEKMTIVTWGENREIISGGKNIKVISVLNYLEGLGQEHQNSK